MLLGRPPRSYLLTLVLTIFLLSNLALAQSGVQYIYDQAGRLVGVIDPSGNAAAYTYDSVGNLLSIARYTSSQISVLTFTPTSGPVGTAVTITGTAFSTTIGQDSVSFNGTTALITSATANQIVATVPSGATTGPIRITTPAGSWTTTTSFTVTASNGSPTITNFSPQSGTPGTALAITGTNFYSTVSDDAVRLNITRALVSGATSTQINATVPANSGSGRIVLTTPGGQAISSQDFYVPFGTHSAANIGFAGRITTGGSQPVSLLGQIGLLLFDATPGQKATLQLSGSTFSSCTIYIFGPTTTQLVSSSCSSSIVGATLLPTAGTYTIGIDPGANTGSITVGLNLPPGPTPPPSRTVSSVVNYSNPLSTHLVGLYLMNEGSGSADKNLPDAQVATFSGTALPTWNTADPSVVFAGGSSLASYLNGGTDLIFDQLPTSQMTIVAKVYVNTLAAAGVAEKNDGNSADSGFVFGWDSSGTLGLTVEKSAGDMRVATTSGVIRAGQWMQIAFTWDGTTGTALAAHLFLNGVEQPKASSADGSGTLGYANATNKPFRIGNASFDVAGSLNGKMAYLAVYKGRILSTTELSQLDAQLPIDNSDVTGTITPNGSVVPVATSNPGQNAQLSFNGIVEQQATVQVTGNTIGSVTVSLLNPDGTTTTSLSSSSTTFNLPTGNLAATTLYRIYIHPNGNSSGNINVQLVTQGGAGSIPPRPAGSMEDPNNPLSPSLVGLFLMNEGSGTTDQNVADGRLATFSGTTLPAWNTADPSVVFGGGSSLASYLNAGSDLAFDQLTTNKMTIVAKVYVNTLAAAGVAEKNDGNSHDSGFVFGWDSNGALHLTVEASSRDMRVATMNGLISAGQWIQVAFTWDGTNSSGPASNAHLFLNGVEYPKASSTDGGGTVGYANATGQPFRIGNASFDVAGSLSGKMAYLAVYKGRILTTTEMGQLDAQVPIPANSTDLVRTITPNGTPVTVTTTNPGQKARLLFIGTIEQQASVQLSGNTIGSVTVSLLKPDNTTVVNSVTSSSAAFSLPESWLPTSGVYTISIQPTGNTNGSITAALMVYNAPPRPTGSVLDSSNALSTNLAGLFLMNEGSGTTDLDLEDSQPATFSGTSVPTWNSTDPSIVFNGGSSLNSYLNAGTDLTFDQLTTNKMTIVAKVYVSTLAAAGVAEKNDGNSADSGFVFGWDSSGTLRLTVEKSAADMRVATTSGLINAGQWIQVAFTWDGTTGTASASHLFLNGVEYPKASSADGSGTLGYANATNKPFRIGNASFDVAGSLNGKMAYLAVYKGRILTTTEMNTLDTSLPIK